MKIIVISGKSGSGKDTIANIMKNKLESSGLSCVILHYADLVKYYAKQYYNWNGVKDESGRTLLQKLGTDKVRAKFPDYWAETIAKFLSAVSDDFDCALIPDARFLNEIEVVKQYNPGAISLRIERYNINNLPYINPEFTKEQLIHPSETSLDTYEDFDYIVENHNDNLEELEESANTILTDIGLLSKGE